MSTPKQRPARRVQDWPTLFFHFIESRRHSPFAWGKMDCCLFACDGVLAQTGLDPAACLYRGQYHDALGAARLVRKHGGIEALAAKVCAGLGFVEVPVRLAQRGDIVAIAGEALGEDVPYLGAALGLCTGPAAAFTGAAGLVFYPLKSCHRAWRVGVPA
jgi:hypothetical protein